MRHCGGMLVLGLILGDEEGCRCCSVYAELTVGDRLLCAFFFLFTFLFFFVFSPMVSDKQSLCTEHDANLSEPGALVPLVRPMTRYDSQEERLSRGEWSSDLCASVRRGRRAFVRASKLIQLF